MRIELLVTIEAVSGTVTVITASDLAEVLPGLAFSVLEGLDRAGPRFGTTIVVDGELDEAREVVARHLQGLRRLSLQLPDAVIRIQAVPDGGELQLSGGTFGEHESELAALLGPIVGGQQWRLYVSFRLGEDGHDHLQRLVERAVAPTYQPTIDRSPTALAVGFDVDGDGAKVAALVELLRFAWRQEGSDVEALVEVEGVEPVVATLCTWGDWLALERRFRPAPPRMATVSEVRELPELAGVLGVGGLSWIDDEEHIVGIEGDKLCALSERAETEQAAGEVRRRADGSVYFAHAKGNVELPPSGAHTERRLHASWEDAAVFSDTEGSRDASTRLFVVEPNGLRDGPRLARVLGIDADEREVVALAHSDGQVALIGFGPLWQRREGRPWREGEAPTDVALIGAARVAVTVEAGTRSTLYLVERANLTYARTLAVPCVAPQIVATGNGTVWISGLAPQPGPPRCHVFRVELASGHVTLMTAELDAPTIDVVVEPRGEAALLATPRGVYHSGSRGLDEVIELARDEELTGMAYGDVAALFVRGPDGARIVLWPGHTVVRLPSAGYAPRFTARAT